MNKISNSKQLLNILYWAASFAVLLFIITVTLPKKGINWSDVGLYYAISNNYLFGQFNEYGLAGLINALLIKLNFSYLNLSRFFNLLQFFSSILFVISLKMRKQFYWIAPIAVVWILAANAIQILSYETAGLVYLLLGISLLFIGLNYRSSRFWNNFCYAFSAFLFCYSSVTNLILFPSLFFNAIILFFIYPKIRNKAFITAYFIATLACLYLITFKIFPIFKLTYFYHESSSFMGSFMTLLRKAILYSLMPCGFIFLGWVIARSLLLINRKITQYFSMLKKHTSAVTLVLLTLISWFAIKNITSNGDFYSYNNNLLIHSFIYLGGILAIYGWRFDKDKTPLLLALALLLSFEYYLAMTVAVPIPWGIRSFGIAGEILLIVLMWLEYYWMQQPERTWAKILTTLMLLLAAYYSLQKEIYHSFGQFPSADTQKITTITRLDGMYTDPDMFKSLQKIIFIYNQNNCKDKLLIFRQRSPVFYYIFNRRAYSPLLSYFNPYMDLPILLSAKKNHGYCYFTDSNFSQQTKNDIIRLQKFYDWLQKDAKKTVYLSTGCVGCMRGKIRGYIY